jgi:hypothetical protein
MTYAVRTNVAIEDSQAEITDCLRRSGASELVQGWNPSAAFLAFSIAGRSVKLIVPMPAVAEFERTGGGRKRNPAQQRQAHEQAQRARWRALALIVRAKIEAIEIGASTLDREFLADLVMPDGSTVGERLQPELHRALSTGKLPPMLPGAS